MTPACIYCRFSPRPNAGECDSNRKQFQRCRKYCEAHGYQIVSVRWDRDLSGGRADNRPGLQRAIRDGCKRKAVLVVYKLDRLARSTIDALTITQELAQAGADLASITETINTRSAMGRFFLTILAAFAELERAQIRERTSRAMLDHQANGRRMTRATHCPYGKMPDPRGPMIPDRKDPSILRPAQLADDPQEQRVIARIQELRAAGLSFRAIARLLDATRVPCRGARWHDKTVRKILHRSRHATPEKCVRMPT